MTLDELIKAEFEKKKADIAKRVVDGTLTKEEAELMISAVEGRQANSNTAVVVEVDSSNLQTKASSGSSL